LNLDIVSRPLLTCCPDDCQDLQEEGRAMLDLLLHHTEEVERFALPKKRKRERRWDRD